MTDEIIPPALLTLLGENFDPAVGNAHDDEEALPSELENVSTRTFSADVEGGAASDAIREFVFGALG